MSSPWLGDLGGSAVSVGVRPGVAGAEGAAQGALSIPRAGGELLDGSDRAQAVSPPGWELLPLGALLAPLWGSEHHISQICDQQGFMGFTSSWNHGMG